MMTQSAEDLHDAAFGANLRMARERWKLSLREVQDRSEVLAQEWGHQDYRISAAWLVRVENGSGGLSAAKMIALAAIYGLSADAMLSLYSHASNGLTRMDDISQPNTTMLLTSGPLESRARVLLPDELLLEEPPEETRLLPVVAGISPEFRRAVIGRRDRTMEPMIPPGSYILIDTQRKAIAKRRGGVNEFERPIYFLLTRDAYFTGFCELDKDAEYLTLVPHPLSPETNRRWRYRKEIEVLGTVSGIAVRRI